MIVINNSHVPLHFKIENGNNVVLAPRLATTVPDSIMKNATFKTLANAGVIIANDEKKDEKIEEKTNFTNQELTLIKKMEIDISNDNDYEVTMKQTADKEDIYKIMLEEIKEAGKKADGRLSYSKIEKIHKGLKNG